MLKRGTRTSKLARVGGRGCLKGGTALSNTIVPSLLTVENVTPNPRLMMTAISIHDTTKEDAGLLQSIRYTQSAFHIQFPVPQSVSPNAQFSDMYKHQECTAVCNSLSNLIPCPSTRNLIAEQSSCIDTVSRLALAISSNFATPADKHSVQNATKNTFHSTQRTPSDCCADDADYVSVQTAFVCDHLVAKLQHPRSRHPSSKPECDRDDPSDCVQQKLGQSV